MKFKKMVIILLVLSTIGAATVFANEALETLQGKRVIVTVNGKNVNATAYNINGVTMLPLRAVAESMQAMVDAKPPYDRVHVYKPNVHLVLLESSNNRAFAGVEVGKKYEFVVFAQVDSLKVPIDALKVMIVDPNGTTVETQVEELNEQKDTIWYATPTIKQQFRHEGDYKVQLFMRMKGSKDYSLVSEKIIEAKKLNQ